MPPTEDEVATGLALEVGTPTHRRLVKAASAPRPLETGAASSTIQDTEVTSAAPTGWVRGGMTGPLNQALLDIQAKIRAERDAIKNYTKAYLASREGIRVRSLLLCLCFLFFLVGRASAPTRCSPRFSGRLLSRWLGTLISEFQVLTLV